MSSRQAFHGQVGQVVQAETVNQIHHDHGRALTSQERVELNNKVNRLAEEYNESARATWKFLHRAIGIESIEDMRLGQLNTAHILLDLLLERGCLQQKLAQQTAQDLKAGDAASLAEQVKDLTIKLRNAVTERGRVGRIHAEMEARLADTEKKHASSQAAIGRAEAVLGQFMQRCKEAENVGQLLRKKLGRLRLAALVLIVLSIGLGFVAYQQLARANRADVWLSVCVLDGRPYALGSVIDDKTNLQCVRESNGAAAWRRILVKAKKPQY